MVFGLTNNAAAASRFVAPWATSVATCRSCGVSWSAVSGVRPPCALAGAIEFRHCAIRPRVGGERVERRQRGAQGYPGVVPAPHPPQALAVTQLRARTLERVRRTLVPLERRAEVPVDLPVVAQQPATAADAGVRPVVDLGVFGLALEHLQGRTGFAVASEADVRLGQLLRPRRHARTFHAAFKGEAACLLQRRDRGVQCSRRQLEPAEGPSRHGADGLDAVVEAPRERVGDELAALGEAPLRAGDQRQDRERLGLEGRETEVLRHGHGLLGGSRRAGPVAGEQQAPRESDQRGGEGGQGTGGPQRVDHPLRALAPEVGPTGRELGEHELAGEQAHRADVVTLEVVGSLVDERGATARVASQDTRAADHEGGVRPDGRLGMLRDDPCTLGQLLRRARLTAHHRHHRRVESQERCADGVVRFDLLGLVDQQRPHGARRVAEAAHLRTETLRIGSDQRVLVLAHQGVEQSERGVCRAAVVIGLRPVEQTPGAVRTRAAHLRRGRVRAPRDCRRGTDRSLLRDVLELAGDVLVRLDRRGGEVPGAAGAACGFVGRRIGERAMRLSSPRGRRAAVGRRADQRVHERQSPGVDPDQVSDLGGRERVKIEVTGAERFEQRAHLP